MAIIKIIWKKISLHNKTMKTSINFKKIPNFHKIIQIALILKKLLINFHIIIIKIVFVLKKLSINFHKIVKIALILKKLLINFHIIIKIVFVLRKLSKKIQ